MIDLIQGDAPLELERLFKNHRDRWDYCLTSPPYYQLIDYGTNGQLGHEQTADEYIEALATVFSIVYAGMHGSGVLWLNIGDTRSNYSTIRGHGRRGAATQPRRKPEPGTLQTGLIGIPHRLLERLKLDGWHHHQTYIWHRGDGCSSQPQDGRALDTHEYVFALGKSRSHRPELAHKPLNTSVITVPPQRSDFPCKMPDRLAELLLSTATRDRARVIDPFCGTGTTLKAAHARGYDAIGIDLDTSAAAAALEFLQLPLIS